jgi:3' terminal RNA ribose 2'-O-methyltransferase Hen1
MATALHEERIETVARLAVACGAKRLLDLGCGSGELLARLAREPRFQRIVGIDISPQALAAARDLLGLDQRMDDGRIALLEASFAQPDERLRGFDAALLVETIEHIPPQRLSLVEHAVFAWSRPQTVVITTPNQEYNVLHGMPPGAMRHPGHCFEWNRRKFRKWATGLAVRNGYSVVFDAIGAADPLLGSSTQLALFGRKPACA